MKMNKLFGYDIYLIQCNDVMYYLKQFTQAKISIYYLDKIDTYTYRFYTKRKYSYKLRKMNLPIEFEKSIGLIYYLTLFFHNRIKLIGVMSFVIVCLYLNQRILNLKVLGTKQHLNEAIVEKLKYYNVDLFNSKLNTVQIEEVKTKLQNDFKNDIDWLNLYQKGQTFYVEYTNKKESIIQESDIRAIVACKNSVIKQFQIQSGYIVSQVNQFVKKGDVLVSNALVSTFDETIMLYPKGKIYGYTWYDIEKEIPNTIDEGEAFSELLKQSRDELVKIIGDNATIDQEKVLQFETKDSKIVLKVHYIIIEDIACKGEVNESNNQVN